MNPYSQVPGPFLPANIMKSTNTKNMRHLGSVSCKMFPNGKSGASISKNIESKYYLDVRVEKGTAFEKCSCRKPEDEW